MKKTLYLLLFSKILMSSQLNTHLMYIDEDNIKDRVVIKYIDDGSLNIKLNLSKIKNNLNYTYTNSDGYSTDDGGIIPIDFKLDLIEGINKGEICFIEKRREYSDAICYIYSDKNNDFIKYLSIHENHAFVDTKVELVDSQDGLLNGKIYKNFIFNLDNNKIILKRLMQKSNLNIYNLSEAIFQIPISIKTLEQYNNIAYQLEQGKNYSESIYLLEKIIEKFPNRTVAYLNLGDAYMGMKDKAKANKAYQIYIKQMRQKGLEKQIPKRILD